MHIYVSRYKQPYYSNNGAAVYFQREDQSIILYNILLCCWAPVFFLVEECDKHVKL